MRKACLALILFALIAVLGAPRLQASEAQGAYVVVVNPANPRTTLDRKLVEDAFLKKVTTWPDGVAIHPVDLPPSSPVRRRFSEEVLARSVAIVRLYWQQRIFTGRDIPPPELDTDADVVQYVLKRDGGIGYVSAGANVGACKTVTISP